MENLKSKFDLRLYSILIIISIIYCIVIANLLSGFKQLPSPLFGGDYYYQLGSVYHIMDSPMEDWFKSSNSIGDRSTYSPIYGLIVSVFSKITGLQPMASMLYLNIPLIFVLVSTAYFLFYNITKNKVLSIIGLLAFVPFTSLPVLKYTELAQLFAVPLFLISLYMLYEKKTWKRAVFLGLTYGLLALLHATGLLIGTLFVAIFTLHSIFPTFSVSNLKNLSENIRKSTVFFIIAFLMGFVLAQIWWFGPIFLQFGKSPSRVSEWGFQDFTSTTYQFVFLFETISEYFLNFSGPFSLSLSILGIAGLYFLFFKKEDNLEHKFVFLIFLSALLMTFHYFITVPLMGTFFAPNYMALLIFRPVFIILGIYAALRLLTTSKTDSASGFKYAKYLPHLLIILFLIEAIFAYDPWYNSQWKKVGRTSLDSSVLELQSYLLANTSVNDVFLSSNELSFMINALSGRKTVAFRRGHADPFSNLDEREIAAATILYGNNTNEKIRLIKKYNITYIYYDPYWVASEWSFDKTGRITGAFDPILTFDTSENRVQLENSGVQYIPQNTWLDPSMVEGFYKKVDILYISPSNYQFHIAAVWKSDLDSVLQAVWKNDKNGAVVYKVKTD